MRYADHAYDHISNREKDTARVAVLDRKAAETGFSNTADYIHDVQGRDGTRSFVTKEGHVCWANQEAGLVGWNNPDKPGSSTAYPRGEADSTFERLRAKEADRHGRDLSEIEDRGPLSEADRQAPDKGRENGATVIPFKDDPGPDRGGSAPAMAADHDRAPRRELPPPPPPPREREDDTSRQKDQSQGQGR